MTSKPGKVPGPVRVKPRHDEEGHERYDTACAECAAEWSQFVREQVTLVLTHVSPEMRALLLGDLTHHSDR